MSTAVTTPEQSASADQAIADQLDAAVGTPVKVRVMGGDVREGKLKQAGDKDGVRRFQIGRHIVSVDTVTEMVDVPAAAPVRSPADVETQADTGTVTKPGAKAKPAAKPAAAPKPPAERTTLTSGAVVTGKTLTIRCAWVDPDKRTKRQQELFDSGFAGVEKGKTYEAMVKAAGTGKNAADAQPDGTERVIKVQDAFQVRFCPENQKKHRNELRRRKSTARRAAREAAKA